MLDVSKLTPAPWAVHDGGRPDHTVCHENVDDTCAPLFERIGFAVKFDTTDADFIVLARNAFDVMMRRGWYARKGEYAGKEGWFSCWDRADGWSAVLHGAIFDDPFTALVEADKWLTAQEAAK